MSRRRTQNFTGGDLDEGADDEVGTNVVEPPVDTPAAPEPPPQGTTVTDAEAVNPTSLADAYPSAPTQPGFVMSDAPLDDTTGGGTTETGPAAIFTPPLDGEIFPPVDTISRHQNGGIRYEGRIRILDAYQYLGNLSNAPEWVDRNWIAWGDYDPLRAIEPGPALRVPLPSGQFAICRLGDYVTRQEVRLTPDQEGDVRTEVWARDDFRKNFLPVAA